MLILADLLAGEAKAEVKCFKSGHKYKDNTMCALLEFIFIP